MDHMEHASTVIDARAKCELNANKNVKTLEAPTKRSDMTAP